MSLKIRSTFHRIIANDVSFFMTLGFLTGSCIGIHLALA